MSVQMISPNIMDTERSQQTLIREHTCAPEQIFIRKRKRQHLSQLQKLVEAVSDYCKIQPYIQLLTEQTASVTDKATLERLRLSLRLFQAIFNEVKKNLDKCYEQLILQQIQHQSERLKFFEKTLDLNDEKEIQYWRNVAAARHEALSFKLEPSCNFLLAVFHLFSSTQDFTQVVNQFRSYRKQRINAKKLNLSRSEHTPTKKNEFICESHKITKTRQNADCALALELESTSGKETIKALHYDCFQRVTDFNNQSLCCLKFLPESNIKAKEGSDSVFGLNTSTLITNVDSDIKEPSLMATYLMYPVSMIQNDETSLSARPKRRRTPYANDENKLNSCAKSPESKVCNSLSRLFQQLDDQLTNVASTIIDDFESASASDRTVPADHEMSNFLDFECFDTEFLGEKENHHLPKKKGRKAKQKPIIHEGKANETQKVIDPNSDECLSKQLLSYVEMSSSRQSQLLPSSAVARQITGLPILLEDILLSKDYESVTTGVPFNLPTSQTPGSRSTSAETETTTSSITTFSDSSSSFEDQASITFGTRKGRGPLMPEVHETTLPGPSSTDSTVIHHVYECLSKTSGIFTMKSKIYQTRLKAFLPEPAADTQQRYILSISRPPLIPTNAAEAEMIEQLRDLDDSTAPNRKIQNSGYRVADLLEDFLTSIVNKMMFLLVVEYHTWYIHAPAREQLTKHLLQYIWPSRPVIQDNFRTFFLNFVEVRIRHFRDSVARHFREKAKHKEAVDHIADTTVRTTRLRSQLADKRRSIETVTESH